MKEKNQPACKGLHCLRTRVTVSINIAPLRWGEQIDHCRYSIHLNVLAGRVEHISSIAVDYVANISPAMTNRIAEIMACGESPAMAGHVMRLTIPYGGELWRAMFPHVIQMLFSSAWSKAGDDGFMSETNAYFNQISYHRQNEEGDDIYS